MAKTTVSLKQVSFRYNFANDGGAVSTIPMGVFLPANAIILKQIITVETPLTSGGGATFKTGWTGNNGAIGGTAVAYGNFNTLAPLDMALWHMLAITADPSYTFPVTVGSVELNITIGNAAITAGAFVATTIYIESN